MQRIFIFGTLLLMTGVAPAAPTDKDNLYEVEVVVFENKHAQSGDEFGPGGKNSTPIPGLDNAIVPTAPTTGSHKLAGSTAQLKKYGQYRVLSHQRWIQPMDAKGGVKARRIGAGGELDGLVKVYMSRYLHADVHLVFKDEQWGGGLFGGERGGARYYRIDEQRRVKSQEVHYYDHPRFGVLLRVSALEKEPSE